MAKRYQHMVDAIRRDVANQVGGLLWADGWRSKRKPVGWRRAVPAPSGCKIVTNIVFAADTILCMIQAKDEVHLFWDNSNLFTPVRFAAAKHNEVSVANSVRLQFENVYDLARAGRPVASAYCVGSVPPDLGGLWSKLQALGIDVETFERGAQSGKEQAVDQALQTRMLRTVIDSEAPGVAVLLTGDGAGYDDGIGFHRDLERMHRKGWKIEVISWQSACSWALREWATKVGVFVPLDQFYRQVTFVEGGRRTEPVSLRRRRRA